MRQMLAVGLLAVLVPSGIGAQPTIADSYNQARQLLDRAIAAHGGAAALRRARQVRIEFHGEDVWRHQSRSPEPPYDRRPLAGALRFDLEAGRVTFDASRSYPGDIPRRFRFATAADRAYYVNHQRRSYTAEEYPPASEQLNNLSFVPQLLLHLASDSGTRMRALGKVRLGSGQTVDAIATSITNGSLTLGLHPENHRLHAMMSVRNDAVGGAVAAEIEFLDYRDVAGELTPRRRTVAIDGVVIEDVTYQTVAYGEPVPDALVSPPPGYEQRKPEDLAAVRTLAENVWLVGSGSTSLVVALGDELIVIDAAPSASAAVMAHIAKLAPGRTITYVIPTHHHDDHAPGVRTFARAGATVLAAPANKAFFERLIGGAVQTIEKSRVFTAGNRSIEIHNIGPSPHANDMLVAWLPNEGILFEADLIDAAAPGHIEHGANNATTMHFARWLGERGWQVKQFAGGHGAVIDAAAFERLIRSTW